MLFDEFEMPGSGLVIVMSLAAFEDHMQRDVELSIIDRPGQIRGKGPDGKVDGPRMIG